MRKDMIDFFNELFEKAENEGNTEACFKIEEVAAIALTDDEFLEFTQGTTKDGDGVIGWTSQLEVEETTCFCDPDDGHDCFQHTGGSGYV